METATLTPSKKIRMVEGYFSPSEAKDLISSMIDGQISFYKLQHMSCWESDHTLDTQVLDEKIAKLTAMKADLKNLVKEAKTNGSRIKIQSDLSLELVG